MTVIKEAIFPGRCVVCGSRINEGDEIVHVTDVGWGHAHCGGKPPTELNHELCTRCFVYHAGECA